MMQETDRSRNDILLSRILLGEATKEEILQFSEWIKDYQNEIYFDRFKEMWHVSVDTTYVKANAEYNNPKRFVAYIRKTKQRQKVRTGITYTLSAAAIFILFLGIFQFLNNGNRFFSNNVDFSALNYSKDSIRLELNNGKFVKQNL